MATKGLNIILFLSSVRPKRMADRVGKHLLEAIAAKGMNPILMDPLKLDFELLHTPIHFMQNPEEAPTWLKEANEEIKKADAFLIASAEYNCSLPPALSNMMDHFPPASYRNRPCGILTYSLGSFGGIRAGTLLRTFVAEFGMLPVPSSVVIPEIHKAITEEGVVNEERISKNVNKQLEELRWFATAIKNQTALEPLPQ